MRQCIRQFWCRRLLLLGCLLASTCAVPPGLASDFALPEKIKVLPVFLRPTDQPEPAEALYGKFTAHLLWAQQRYLEMLDNRDTFLIATNKPTLVTGKKTLAEYKVAPEGGASVYVSELLEHFNFTRFNCPYVFVILLVNSVDAFPGAGGRPFNRGWNSGGGMLMMSSWDLDHAPNFQSTLQHELGHSFGLSHVSAYDYDMGTNASIMSYNLDHWTSGFTPSATPGILIPEDIRILLQNRRVFSKLQFNPATDTPAGYAIAPNFPVFGPQDLPGQVPYALGAVTSIGGNYTGPPTAMLINHLKPRLGPDASFDASNMWHSQFSTNGWVAVDVTFPLSVTLDRVRIHSQYGGNKWMATRTRIQRLRAGNFETVTSNVLHQADQEVSFTAAAADTWRFHFYNPEGYVVIRGLEFFSGNQDVFPPAIKPLESAVAPGNPPLIQFFAPTIAFSVTNGNPDGPWQYGWTPAGSEELHQFSEYGPLASGAGSGWYRPVTQTPAVWRNTSNSQIQGVPPGVLAFHPGPAGEPAILRWTSPRAGSLELSGEFFPGDSGSPQVGIRKNGALLWNRLGHGRFDLITDVDTDSSIDFVVSGDPQQASTPLQVVLALLPPPFSLNLARAGVTNTISFSSVTGAVYVLERRASVSPHGAWTNLGTNTALAGGELSFTDAPAEPTSLYRVRRLE